MPADSAGPLSLARYIGVMRLAAPRAAPSARLRYGYPRAGEGVIAKAAGLANWEFFSGHSGRVGMARGMAQNGAPTHEFERQGRWKQGGGMVGRYHPRRICWLGAAVPVTAGS